MLVVWVPLITLQYSVCLKLHPNEVKWTFNHEKIICQNVKQIRYISLMVLSYFFFKSEIVYNILYLNISSIYIVKCEFSCCIVLFSTYCGRCTNRTYDIELLKKQSELPVYACLFSLLIYTLKVTICLSTTLIKQVDICCYGLLFLRVIMLRNWHNWQVTGQPTHL